MRPLCSLELVQDPVRSVRGRSLMSGFNFTDRVRWLLQASREEAARLRNAHVGTEHFLLALIRDKKGGVAHRVLLSLHPDLEGIRRAVESRIKPGESAIAERQDFPYTSQAKKVLELAMNEANELNHRYVGTEHLLLGLLREEK